MLDHDDPMLCPDAHSEAEIAQRLAEIKGGLRKARGMQTDRPAIEPNRHPLALPLDQFVEIYPADEVGVLDPHAGAVCLTVPRELLVSVLEHMWGSARCPKSIALRERLAGVLA